jgi:5-methyltetrahydropteroyltriglutamate--homocysteine methyltransferase
MLRTTVAGSLPKPSWLAAPQMLWAPWRQTGEALAEAQADATTLAVRLQRQAGVDIPSDGEQARQHFVHGFLAGVDGIDFENKVTMGIRNNRYEAQVPQVIGALERKGRVHSREAKAARAATDGKVKFTLPGPMTIVDTIADRHYGDRTKMAMEFARLLNDEAKELEAIGIDTIQFDEPAFNVFTDEVLDWGIPALLRAAEGLSCTTAVHVCYGYGIKANVDWKKTLGDEWRQYERIFPALAKSPIRQVSLEVANSKVPVEFIGLLAGKDVLVGCIDVASETVETPEEVAATIRRAMKYVPPQRLFPCTNCGMAPMARDLAYAKLSALSAGAALVRAELAR